MFVADALTARLLEELQVGLKFLERPFAELGMRVDLDEREVIARMKEARNAGVLRQVAPIYEPQALGYSSSLVAMKCRREDEAAAAAVLNRHPGVTHNYAREHEIFNLWFTIAVPPAEDLAAHAAKLKELSGAETMRLLPALRVYKIGVVLRLSGAAGGREPALSSHATGRENRRVGGQERPLTDLERKVLRLLQNDLPLAPEPFAGCASAAGVSTGKLLETANLLLAEGRIRRLAGILSPRRAGFHANGMGVWEVPLEEVDRVGEALGRAPEVTHCCRRPICPGWPYALFTMVHGRKRAQVEEVMERLSHACGVSRYRLLFSRREYKKVRLRFFTGEIERWAREHQVVPGV